MLKILTVVGTRPEAIKMAPVVKALDAHPGVEHRLCITGQHRQMLDQVLELFALKTHYDFELMKPGQTLTDIAVGVLQGAERVLRDFKPQRVLVHGDTSTSFIAALASFYQQVPVAHVEAGLRTHDIHSPWPEEANRQLTSRVTDLHLAPTAQARVNLLAERVPDSNIVVTGNTVIDALLETVRRLDGNVTLSAQCTVRFPFIDPARRLILVTGHRRENFGGAFERICRALKRIAALERTQVLYPVHMNPNVAEPVRRLLGDTPNVFLIDPVEYLAFVYLMKRSHIILTDSGGIQEEAPSLGKPVLVMRENTERPEAVAAGVVRLVGTREDAIVDAVAELLGDKRAYQAMAGGSNPYGDGLAAERIVHAIEAKHALKA
jgi:UDP-N-acetylglucosamine 2-epimerase (non-hydrolysing)